ncbi:hypothetical protein B0T21DRAFT_454336 [Apiosordaria backusii]|uniref:Prolyl 4-hydroxylase alpha subunit Fe(2+) 2OG dioxygenase domain-containing protein n=1 Tax=Apiosordaria backusii TaxID=314023 RepID=A0AA40AIN6_9PEZI|nr:hypothetical protein B0T21DRAFT_454336 [Apiosordaria backusii]
MDCNTNPKQPAPDKATLKRDIFAALDSISSCGNFATTGYLNQAGHNDSDIRPPDHDLPFVEGYGEIGHKRNWAGTELEVRELIEKYAMPNCKLATHDDFRNNLLKLDTTQFTEGLSWRDFVHDKIRPRVCQELGVSPHVAVSVRAKIRNIVLQQRGPINQVQLSSDPSPDVFGTLVVCRPGFTLDSGDILLTHHGKHMVYRTMESAWSYAAWYSQVDHEIRPLSGGSRIMMVFDLSFDSREPSTHRPSTATMTVPQADKIRVALRPWLESHQAPNALDCLYYPLEYTYSDNMVWPGSLRFRDRARAQVLDELASGPDFPFEVFIAEVHEEKPKTCDPDPNMSLKAIAIPEGELMKLDPDMKTLSVCYSIRAVYDMGGKKLYKHGSVLLDTPIAREDGDRKNDPNSPGDCVCIDRFYTTALVLVPRCQLTKLLPCTGLDVTADLGSKTCSSEVFSYLARMILRGRDCPESTQMFLSICAMKEDDGSPCKLLKSITKYDNHVLQATLYLERFDLFNQLISERSMNEPWDDMGFVPCELLLWVRKWLDTDRFDAAATFARIQDGHKIPELNRWIEARLQDCLRTRLADVEVPTTIRTTRTVYCLLILIHHIPDSRVVQYFADLVLYIIKFPQARYAEIISVCGIFHDHAITWSNQRRPDNLERAIRLFNVGAALLVEALDLSSLGLVTSDELFKLFETSMRVHGYCLELYPESASEKALLPSPWTQFIAKFSSGAPPISCNNDRDVWLGFLKRALAHEQVDSLHEQVDSLQAWLRKNPRDRHGLYLARTSFLFTVTKLFATQFVGRGCGSAERESHFYAELESEGLADDDGDWDPAFSELYEAVRQKKLHLIENQEDTSSQLPYPFKVVELPYPCEVAPQQQRRGRAKAKVKRRKSKNACGWKMEDYVRELSG